MTNAAGDTASRSVTVTVRQALGPGTVTLVRRSASGALEPAAGIAVHRSDASSGAFLETLTSDAAGRVDFGDPGSARSTYSVVRPGPAGRTVVVSFVAVPAGALTLRLDRLPDVPDQASSIEAAVSPSSWGAAVILPSTGLLALDENHTLAIDRGDLPDDGRVTLLGQTGGGELGPVRCGLLLDVPLPAAGSSVTIPLDQDGAGVVVNSPQAATATLSARRKGVTFTSRDPTAWPRTSSELGTCLPLLPDVEAWTLTGDAFQSPVRTSEGYALVDTIPGKRLRVTWAGRLRGTVDLDFQDLTLAALTYGGGVVHATASGALADAIDLAHVAVASDTVEWHAFAAGAAALALPEVPGVSAPAWADGVLVDAELVALLGHPGFDALWAEARDVGSLQAALLGHASASATGKLSRFTPSYTIGFDGYFWERYGLIASSDGRIHCGASCATGWPAGTTVHLTATPNPGAEFRGWGGQCAGYGNAPAIDVLVERDILCNPSFGPASSNSFGLQVAAANWPALITSDDGRIKCGDDRNGNHFDLCADYGFNAGYGLTLTVAPEMTTVVFDVAWRGDCSGTGASTFVAMDGSKACGVELTPRP